MSDSSLTRIEERLDALARQQNEMCSVLEQLGKRVEGLRATHDSSSRKLLEFLDEFRAGEALGEAAIGAWIHVSTTECLRGGLRTIQMREGMHARLLEQRIKELGGAVCHEIPEARYRMTMEGAGSTALSDAQKVAGFLSEFPDIDAALKPIQDWVKKLDGDPETQSLLSTIAQDERSTLEFLGEACALLNPS